MSDWITCMMGIMLIALGGSLVRTLRGPHLADRLLGLNSITSAVVAMLVMLSVFQGQESLVDVALLYALLNMVAMMGFIHYIPVPPGAVPPKQTILADKSR